MKNANISFFSASFENVTKIEIETRPNGQQRVYFWQAAGDGWNEIAGSFGINENTGNTLPVIVVPEPVAAEPVYRGKLRQFAPTTLAAAERRLRRGWSSNASLRRVTGLAHSSIPAMLTDLRRSGVKIERRRGFVGQWRVANV